MEVIGKNQAWDRPFDWHYYQVTPETLTGADVEIELDTLPQGTVITDYNVTVLVAEAGATTSALDVEVGSRTILDCGVDSLGSLNRTSLESESADPTLANSDLLTAERVLKCEIAYAGTATTAPTFVVGVLGGRLSY